MNKFEFTYYDFLPFTQTNLKKNLQYLQTDDDKKKGLKNEEGEIGGYCYPWCVFYLHMRIANPDVPPHTLLQNLDKEIDSLDKNSKRNFIRSYAKNFMVFLPKKLEM